MSDKDFIVRNVLLAFCCSFLIFFNHVRAADTCQPATWRARMMIQTAAPTKPTATAPPPPPSFKNALADPVTVEPGQVVCKYYGVTDDEVNYYTCTAMADFYSITLQEFFTLNPSLDPDCSNILSATSYCVRGYIQPVVSTDGFCGPSHNNATCQLTLQPCCNSETWQCGNSTADCAPGTCWDGVCPGHNIYGTDGKCGYQNNGALCAGKWGDCCNMDGQCGTGDDFCGDGKCQSGNCTTPLLPTPPPPNNETVYTPDGTCGPANEYHCDVVYGYCCNSDNMCGSLPQDCSASLGCQSQYGTCDDSSAGASLASTLGGLKNTTNTNSTVASASIPLSQPKPSKIRFSSSSSKTAAFRRR